MALIPQVEPPIEFARDLGSLDEFVDWFLASSQGKFGEETAVLSACLAVEMALSRLYYEGIGEAEFREPPSAVAVVKGERWQPQAAEPLAKP